MALPGHRFWAGDAVPTGQSVFGRVVLVGHRQVTDAYLLVLCLAPNGRLATFDRGVQELLADAAARDTFTELLS